MIREKQILRSKYKELRQKVKNKNIDHVIVERLLNSAFYRDADIVFVYSSVGSEIDTIDIIRDALSCGKTLSMPVCVDKNGHMEFYTVEDEISSFRKGMFSIAEPDINKCKKTVFSDKSLCIVPGLSFDKNGYRLGYGKGYYDRFLSNFKGLSVGLCYEKCFCQRLPFDEFDCKVDKIITENDIYSVNEEEYIYG